MNTVTTQSRQRTLNMFSSSYNEHSHHTVPSPHLEHVQQELQNTVTTRSRHRTLNMFSRSYNEHSHHTVPSPHLEHVQQQQLQ